MHRTLAVAAMFSLLALGCSNNNGDGDITVTGGTDGAGIVTSGTGGSEQAGSIAGTTETGGTMNAGASGSAAGSGGNTPIESLCPGGAATKTLILVETVEDLAALSECTSLNGLTIFISDDTTLDALNKLTTMSGALTIEDCGISSLQALSNLTNVGGDLVIKNCSALTSLNGLNNLKTIGGSLRIRENPVLSDITAFGSLESIGVGTDQGLMFRDNPSLPTCVAKDLATKLGIADETLIMICGGQTDACGSDPCQPET